LYLETHNLISILFSVLENEGSFTEDADLMNGHLLIEPFVMKRDVISFAEPTVYGQRLQPSLILSGVFVLVFPKYNVFDLLAGGMKSVYDGYEVIPRPHSSGHHRIDLGGERVSEQVVG
jgi:hypothetical protein